MPIECFFNRNCTKQVLILSLNYELLEVWLVAWLMCKDKYIGPILSWKLVLNRATIQKILYTPKKEENKIRFIVPDIPV